MSNGASLELQAVPEWWMGAVIYQIYPLSYKDSNGDGTGDLPGILEKLDYIASLGVDAIWICPFFKSPMRDFGYDVSDYCAVDLRFGSMADVDRLIGRAHDLGLKVILDLVPCHTSDEHPWFVESRRNRTNTKSDWYVWADARPDGCPPNNWLSIFGGSAWAWEPRRSQYYLHEFLVSQPALNLRNPQVLNAIIGIMRFWYERGADGFRLDAITALAPDRDLRSNPPIASDEPLPYVDGGMGNPFLRQVHLFDRDGPDVLPMLSAFRRLGDEYHPPRFLFGEIGDVDGCAVGAKYTQPNLIHAAFIQDLILTDLSAERATTVCRRLTELIGEGWVVNAFSSQDIARHLTRWRHLAGAEGDSRKLAKLLLGLLLCMRGCTCLYQGEELGLTDVDLPLDAIRDPWGLAMYPDYKGRDSCRTPMPWSSTQPNAGFTSGVPWLPLGPTHKELAVDVQEGDPDSVLNAYRRFIKWRKKHAALRWGTSHILEAPEPLFAFEREWQGQHILAVFNLSPDRAKWRPSGEWIELEGHGLLAAAFASGELHFEGLDVFLGTRRSGDTGAAG